MAARCAAGRRVYSSRSSAGSIALARILRLEIAQMIRLLFARPPRHRSGHCPVRVIGQWRASASEWGWGEGVGVGSINV